MSVPSSVSVHPTKQSFRSVWRNATKLLHAPMAAVSSIAKPESRANGKDENARAAVRASDFSIEALLDEVADIVFIASDKGAIEYMNDYLEDYTGLPLEHATRAALVDIIHPGDRRRVAMKSVHAAKGPEPFSVECRLRAASGIYKWFLIRAAPRQNTGATWWYVLGIEIEELRRRQPPPPAGQLDAHSVLDSISDCYLELDKQLRITALNKHTERWLGESISSLIGVDYRALGHMASLVADSAQAQLSSQKAFESAVEDAVHRGIPFHQQRPSMLFPERWIDLQITPSTEGALILFRDITNERLDHQRLTRSLGLIQSSLDALPARVAILDAKGFVIAINKAWRQFQRLTKAPDNATMMGSSYCEWCENAKVRQGLLDVIAGRSGFQGSYHLDTPVGQRWYQVTITTFKQSEFARIVVAHEDVTELINNRQSIADLHTRLISIQEEERQRIAIELHDSTAQYLVAAGLTMSRLQGLVPRGEAQKLCDDIEGMIDDALRELRTFTYLLHPIGLSGDGLIVTLRRFALGLQKRASLEVHLQLEDGIDDLPFEFQRTVLRIAQEALANAHRHAAATRVDLSIGLDGSTLRLEITDNGRGMPHELPAELSDGVEVGVGIAGMRARVAQYGGTIDFPSSSLGTTVIAMIPLPDAFGEVLPPIAEPIDALAQDTSRSGSKVRSKRSAESLAF